MQNILKKDKTAGSHANKPAKTEKVNGYLSDKVVFSKNDTAVVKGVAIVMMLFHHLFTSAERYAGYDIVFSPVSEGLTVEIASFFKICVAIFVFISGYGISASLSKIRLDDFDGYKRQLKHRYFSLMSTFWFIYILGLISAAIIMPSMLKVYKGTFDVDFIIFAFFDFMGVSELFGTPTLIGTWWYMSLALLIIAVMPLLYRLYKKFGCFPLLMLTFFICGIVYKAYNDKVINFDMVRWTFTLVLGMICEEKNLLARIKTFRIVKKSKALDFIIKFIIMTAGLAFCLYLRQRSTWAVSYIRDGFVPAYVVLYCYVILCDIPIINGILKFLGKHSYNIFLSHTFLRGFYLKDFIYGFKYPIVIFIVLLALSVLLSVVIDLLKKYSGYDKLMKRLINRVCK